jgi:hypothetical protein
MRKLTHLVVGLVLLGAGFGFGYSWAHRQAKPLPPTRAASESTAACVEVVDAKLDQPNPNGACTLYPCVTGTIGNHCDRRFVSVLLVFNLYDESGVQVASTQDSVSNLEPHGRARFVAQFLASPRIKQFKVVQILAAPAH